MMSASFAALPWPVSPVHRVGRRSNPRRVGNQPLKSLMAEAEERRFCAGAPEQKLVRDVVQKQATMAKRLLQIRNEDMQDKPDIELPASVTSLTEAYHRCREICANNSKTYYLGSMLLTPERQKAVWAIYAWGTRMDLVVDGPAALQIKSTALESWEARLEDIFRGRPLDIIDAALSDTISKFPIDIQLLKDLIWGMKMDLRKSRYKNFDEMYLYCYLVSGTAAMMAVPVLGIVPNAETEMESFYNGVLALAIGNELANILRDVGEDARHRGRIYLPQDELAQAGLSEADIFGGEVTDKWRDFMKKQIERARKFYDDGEKCVMELNSASRWPVLVTLMLSRQILEEIEANDYNNLTKVATVSMPKKMLALSRTYVQSLLGYPRRRPSF